LSYKKDETELEYANDKINRNNKCSIRETTVEKKHPKTECSNFDNEMKKK
jgi:hypothetical protein